MGVIVSLRMNQENMHLEVLGQICPDRTIRHRMCNSFHFLLLPYALLLKADGFKLINYLSTYF